MISGALAASHRTRPRPDRCCLFIGIGIGIASAVLVRRSPFAPPAASCRLTIIDDDDDPETEQVEVAAISFASCSGFLASGFLGFLGFLGFCLPVFVFSVPGFCERHWRSPKWPSTAEDKKKWIGFVRVLLACAPFRIAPRGALSSSWQNKKFIKMPLPPFPSLPTRLLQIHPKP
jgi:hypothetical protein